jgi:hypothetical protein
MAALASIYQNALQAEQVAMYWEVLGKFNPDYLDAAVKLHISDEVEGKWFPKPAHLIGHMNKMIGKQKRIDYHANILLASSKPKPKPPTEKQKADIAEMIKQLKG